MKTLPQRRLLGACTAVLERLLLLLAHCVCVCARARVNDVFRMIFPNEIAAQKNTRKVKKKKIKKRKTRRRKVRVTSREVLIIKKSFAREANNGG